MKRLLSFFALTAVSLSFAGISHATNIHYNFSNLVFGGHIYENGQTNADTHSYFYSNNGSASVLFDSDDGRTGDIIINLTATGNVRDRTGGAFGATTVAETEMFSTLTINNVLAITDPEGIIGFSGLGATSAGTTTIRDIGDVDGDGQGDAFSFDYMSKFMNFANFSHRENDYRAELSHLGNSNFFLWNSEVFNDLVAKSWFAGTGGYQLNYNNSGLFGGVVGDIHLQNGAEVPEPMTAALLGLGLIGGAVRRKQTEAKE